MLFIQVSQTRNLPLNTSGPRQARSKSVSAPYQVRTISVCIDTEQVRTWHGADTDRIGFVYLMR